jgi:hypothetical protein
VVSCRRIRCTQGRRLVFVRRSGEVERGDWGPVVTTSVGRLCRTHHLDVQARVRILKGKNASKELQCPVRGSFVDQLCERGPLISLMETTHIILVYGSLGTNTTTKAQSHLQSHDTGHSQ